MSHKVPGTKEPIPSVPFTGQAKKPAARASLPEPLIDSDQAAALIGIHPKTLQKMARAGEIKGVHIGKLWRFRASYIEEWITERLAS